MKKDRKDGKMWRLSRKTQFEKKIQGKYVKLSEENFPKPKDRSQAPTKYPGQ